MSVNISDTHGARLLRMAPARIVPALGEELESGARVIVDDAKASIEEGAIRGKGHIPAPPGGPPNSDTGDLVDSGHVGELIETPGHIQTGAIFDSDHALYQERGTSRMEPRPFLEPATERARGDIIDALGKRYVAEVNQ